MNYQLSSGKINSYEITVPENVTLIQMLFYIFTHFK